MNAPFTAFSPTDPPVRELPPLRLSVIPGTAFDVLNAMHENIIENFRNATAPNLVFPSLWRLAKHVCNERGPLFVYRYFEEPHTT
jgi:hypothetical protein